ncbi:MAG: hypothetical protein ACRESE_04570 [Gammaproteobacteria bacterium]
MKSLTITVLGLAILLAGCASTPSVPYWENPQWVNALSETVHKDIQYPNDAATEDFPSGTAIVTFTYDNGKLKAPRILKSTGSPILDAAIVKQISNIPPPQAQGLNIAAPHDFEMEIGMYAADTKFFKVISYAIGSHLRHVHWPVAAQWRGMKQGAVGWVIVGFQYRNGIILDTEIVQSNGNAILDKLVLNSLRTTPMPMPPDLAKNKILNIQAPFCFPSRPGECRNNGTQIQYVSASESTIPQKPPCAEIGYRNKYGITSNLHLIESSGDANFDKRALAAVSEGKFPHPSRWDDAVSDYNIPICNNSGPDDTSPKAIIH